MCHSSPPSCPLFFFFSFPQCCCFSHVPCLLTSVKREWLFFREMEKFKTKRFEPLEHERKNEKKRPCGTHYVVRNWNAQAMLAAGRYERMMWNEGESSVLSSPHTIYSQRANNGEDNNFRWNFCTFNAFNHLKNSFFLRLPLLLTMLPMPPMSFFLCHFLFSFFFWLFCGTRTKRQKLLPSFVRVHVVLRRIAKYWTR